jgi:hypothetical protein
MRDPSKRRRRRPADALLSRSVIEDPVDQLQARLGAALAANRPGSGISHVLVVLPSYSVSESILSHYGDRIASLEHRYLNALLVAARIPDCDLVFVSTKRPDDVAVDAVLDLLPSDRRAEVRSRIHLHEVDDGTPRSVAAKLADRPDLLSEIRERIASRPAFIEPWNVTESEIALALALDVPVNGTRPELRHLGFKSEGRRLLARAGVPVPLGREDVRTADDVISAAAAIRAERPDVQAIVVKHDDSGAGDGNVVLDLGQDDAGRPWTDDLRTQLAALPEWYRTDLERGGVVEERIAGTRFSSPSAQVDIRPGREVVVLATHEQILGGPGGQVYLGCRFPADPSYAAELARHASAMGEELASRGAMGRFSLDFVTASDSDAGDWRVYGLEVNLRKGGTTHPYAALRSVVPGRYDAERAAWIAEDGSTRCYSATDNLVDPEWTGLPPAELLGAVNARGLQFNPERKTGVVLHMLSGLAIDGRFGLTAIAETAEEAAELESGVRAAAAEAAASRTDGVSRGDGSRARRP